MRFDIATLFPEMCDAAMDTSVIGRARREGKFIVNCHNIRDYTLSKQKRVDDAPYGGGHGMGGLGIGAFLRIKQPFVVLVRELGVDRQPDLSTLGTPRQAHRVFDALARSRQSRHVAGVLLDGEHLLKHGLRLAVGVRGGMLRALLGDGHELGLAIDRGAR